MDELVKALKAAEDRGVETLPFEWPINKKEYGIVNVPLQPLRLAIEEYVDTSAEHVTGKYRNERLKTAKKVHTCLKESGDLAQHIIAHFIIVLNHSLRDWYPAAYSIYKALVEAILDVEEKGDDSANKVE